MNATLLRTYGTIAVSVLVCIIFVAALGAAYITKDTVSQQILIGIIGGQFAGVVGYYVGSSASSAQKDEKENPPHA